MGLAYDLRPAGANGLAGRLARFGIRLAAPRSNHRPQRPPVWMLPRRCLRRGNLRSLLATLDG